MSASVDSSLVAAAGACKCHTWLLGCQVAWLPVCHLHATQMAAINRWQCKSARSRLSSGARFVVAHVHLVGTSEIRELVATLLLPRAGAILQPEVPITSKWRACDGNERCIGARPV